MLTNALKICCSPFKRLQICQL